MNDNTLFIMGYEREIMYMAGAGAAGVLANYAIQTYVPAGGIAGLPYSAGTYKNMLGILGGIGTIALGFYGMKTGKFLKDPRMQLASMAFGGTLLTSTVLQMVTYTGTPFARAYPRAAVRAVPSGAGYAMVSRQQTNIL